MTQSNDQIADQIVDLPCDDCSGTGVDNYEQTCGECGGSGNAQPECE